MLAFRGVYVLLSVEDGDANEASLFVVKIYLFFYKTVSFVWLTIGKTNFIFYNLQKMAFKSTQTST